MAALVLVTTGMVARMPAGGAMAAEIVSLGIMAICVPMATRSIGSSDNSHRGNGCGSDGSDDLGDTT